MYPVPAHLEGNELLPGSCVGSFPAAKKVTDTCTLLPRPLAPISVPCEGSCSESTEELAPAALPADLAVMNKLTLRV